MSLNVVIICICIYVVAREVGGRFECGRGVMLFGRIYLNSSRVVVDL